MNQPSKILDTNMTLRTKPPFRADHVGSFLRPKYLLDAREQFFVKKEISAEQLSQHQVDQQVAAVIGQLDTKRQPLLPRPGQQ